MQPQRPMTLLFLTLTLGALPLSAQQQAPEGAPAPTTQAPAQAGEAAEKSAAQGSATADQPDTTTRPANSSKDSPFDYRSSEEISEDLSVSFPVDI